MVLAQHGEVADDVLGGDVAGDDDDAGERGVAGGGGGGFAERLDDFLDTALEGVVLGSYVKQYQSRSSHTSRMIRRGIGSNIPFRIVL